MAVPTDRTDLSTTPSSNSPAGSDTISGAAGIDEYLRAHASFIKANYDDIQLRATLASPTFTGTVVLPSTTSIGNVSNTEISYLDGVTSAIQTQIDNLVVGGGSFQPLDADLTAIAALTPTDNTVIIGNGSAWVAESGATLKTSLGLTIGSDVQAYNANLATIAGFTPTDSNLIVGNGSAWVLESGDTLRASLGLTLGSQVQAYSAKLADIASLTVTDGNFIVGNGTTWVAEAPATALASLGITASAAELNFVDGVTSAIQTQFTGKQAASSKLTDIAALSAADSNIIVGNGSTWVAESGSTARLSLGAAASTDPTITGWVTATKGFSPDFDTTTHTAASGSVTIDMDAAQSYKVAMSGSITTLTLSNLVTGRVYRLLFTTTTSKTIAWGTAFKWPYAVAPTIDAGTEKAVLVSFMYDGTNRWASFQVY